MLAELLKERCSETAMRFAAGWFTRPSRYPHADLQICSSANLQTLRYADLHLAAPLNREGCFHPPPCHGGFHTRSVMRACFQSLPPGRRCRTEVVESVWFSPAWGFYSLQSGRRFRTPMLLNPSVRGSQTPIAHRNSHLLRIV